MIHHVLSVYRGSNGDLTRELYERLNKLGPIGEMAVNLFRACKTSERAKLYRRGPGHKTASYDRKDWSIENLCRILAEHGAALGIASWGWQIDAAMAAAGDPHHHVVYVDLPQGQVSFHTATRHAGPDYFQPWDGATGAAPDRICRFVASVLEAGASNNAASKHPECTP